MFLLLQHVMAARSFGPSMDLQSLPAPRKRTPHTQPSAAHSGGPLHKATSPWYSATESCVHARVRMYAHACMSAVCAAVSAAGIAASIAGDVAASVAVLSATCA